MQIVTASNGNKTVKMSKSEWQSIGKQAGWMKVAQGFTRDDYVNAKMGEIKVKMEALIECINNKDDSEALHRIELLEMSLDQLKRAF